MRKTSWVATILLATMCSTPLLAQKFGKVSAEDWSMKQYPDAPDAPAVILYKSVEAVYELSNSFSSYSGANLDLSVNSIAHSGTNNIDFEGTRTTYNYKIRTKILKDEGKGYANIDILYYDAKNKSREEFDDLGHLKVVILSQNEKGKVSKYSLRTNEFVTEQYNDFYKVLHITVPQAKAGDIIEYQYQITSSRPTFLYDWSFQEDIPVMYSKCDYDIPFMLSFNMNTPIDKRIKSSVEQGVIRLQSSSGDMKAPKSLPTNHYIIEGTNILPKSMDDSRKDDNIEAAKMTATRGKISNLNATIKGISNKLPAPLPNDKGHLTFNPKQK